MFDSQAIIELQNAFIYQGKNLILQNVEISVSKGELVYLVGKTGSGKSSLLKTMYCDIPLTNGSGKVSGYDLKKIKRNEIRYFTSIASDISTQPHWTKSSS